MHKDNIFLTLTYDDAHLESPRLIYGHFQQFMRDLRNHVGHTPESRIGLMVTGEYGELNKRPHWHALLFNYAPPDPVHKYTAHNDDPVYTSKTIDELWGRGLAEYGSVTLDSAGYVARYAAKKLVHGKDQEHDYHPIHKTSSKNAIGKTWIEKYWETTFNNGFVTVNGHDLPIPRYYSDWLKKNRPSAYVRYVTQTREKTIRFAEEAARKEELYYLNAMLSHPCGGPHMPLSRPAVKERVLQRKFKHLQEHLKL